MAGVDTKRRVGVAGGQQYPNIGHLVGNEKLNQEPDYKINTSLHNSKTLLNIKGL